jgi:hypothetical protein
MPNYYIFTKIGNLNSGEGSTFLNSKYQLYWLPLNESYPEIITKFPDIQSKDELKWCLAKKAIAHYGQSKQFRQSKAKHIKLKRPLNSKKIWSPGFGDLFTQGLIIDLNVYDILKKYTQYLYFTPVVQGKDNHLEGYMIAPYISLGEKIFLTKDNYIIDDYIADKVVYKKEMFEDTPPIFSFDFYSSPFDAEFTNFGNLYFHESIAKELMAIGVKMKPLNLI